ncbi:hypothetical protein ACROYT_G034146 [Oculina patagonica]
MSSSTLSSRNNGSQPAKAEIAREHSNTLTVHQCPCQPFHSNQTALCSEFQTVIQENGPGAVCNSSEASCNVNVTRAPPNRKEGGWGNCYCDPLCKEIGDCCVDYDTWHPPNVPTKPKIKAVKLSCRQVPTNQKNRMRGYVMIDSCPSSWRDAETARACMSTNYSADPVVALPLLDMTTNVTYANIYCAMCHGKSRDLHHWSLRVERFLGVKAPNGSLHDIISSDRTERWEAIPVGEIIPDTCVLTPTEANTGPDTAIKRLCRSYANRIVVRNDNTQTQGGEMFRHFKNPHCALLSSPSMLANQTVRCFEIIRFPPSLSTMLFVFSNLTKIPPDDLRIQSVRVKFNCQMNEVYDPFQERCLPLHLSRSDSNNTNSTNVTRNCHGLRFPSHEFRVLSNNSVFIIPHQKLYNNDSYILVNQTLILCAKFSRNYTRKSTPARPENENSSNHSLALRIVTYVGFSLSIISLLILLMTYFLFDELRTYPGKKVMHLSCAMIAMQTVYFVSDPDVVSAAVCAVMGALLHYFILVMFLWMSVIAHNTQKTFSTLNVDLNNPLVIAKRKKSYIRSCVFAWGLPLVAVGICVTLQLTNTGNIGYGNEDGCQLSLPARSFAVAGPVTALLIFNIFALIRTAIAINQQGNMATASQRNLPVIVLKMTVVMGIAWILGFVLAFYPTPYLEYPFVIINSCQGVLICVSFVFNKHVFTLYKQRFMTATNPEPAAGAADQQAGSAQQP